ncbi:MAG: hypothetical protein K6C69_02705 [Lachnospiraceae bacterium]|nr:hypothetical protein [Lachnospiraceae bacterium]
MSRRRRSSNGKHKNSKTNHSKNRPFIIGKQIYKSFMGNQSRVMGIIFVMILLYLSAFFLVYLTKEKVDIHEVTEGAISTNNTYTGLILRNEKIYYTDYSGNINYFIREGERVGVESVVYTIDETGRVASMIESMNASEQSMSESNQGIVRNTLSSYKTARTPENFYELYNLSEKLNQVIADSVNENIVANLDTMIADTGSQQYFNYVRSTATGLISYMVDGYEELTLDQITEEMFDKGTYTKNNLRKTNLVAESDPVYKLITSEDWKIVIPLTNEAIEEQRLNERKTVAIRFINEDITTNANFTIAPVNGQTYGVLSLNKYMIQYCSERFVDIELITSETAGLKIPISSIVEKECYTIPAVYALDANTNRVQFNIIHYSEGETTPSEEYITVFALKDDLYYISKNDISPGDVIVYSPDAAPQSANYSTKVGTISEESEDLIEEMYRIEKIDLLTGVYSVDKGYAVFKNIDIIEQNTEYAICSDSTRFGLSAYDHIVLDGTKVEENQIIY